MDKTPASAVRVALPVTSVDVIGAALACPVTALENIAGKDVDGVRRPHMGSWPMPGAAAQNTVRGGMLY